MIKGARYRFKRIHGGLLRLAFRRNKVKEVAVFKYVRGNLKKLSTKRFR